MALPSRSVNDEGYTYTHTHTPLTNSVCVLRWLSIHSLHNPPSHAVWPTRLVPIQVKLLSDLSAEHLQHQRGQLHAVFGLEREGVVLFGVLFVQAAEVRQLLDHLSVEQTPLRVMCTDVRLQNLRYSVLQHFHSLVVLHPGPVYEYTNTDKWDSCLHVWSLSLSIISQSVICLVHMVYI